MNCGADFCSFSLFRSRIIQRASESVSDSVTGNTKREANSTSKPTRKIARELPKFTARIREQKAKQGTYHLFILLTQSLVVVFRSAISCGFGAPAQYMVGYLNANHNIWWSWNG